MCRIGTGCRSARPPRGESNEPYSLRGIRVALLVGAILTLGALIAGFFIFPRGTKEEADEAAEATHLEVEENA